MPRILAIAGSYREGGVIDQAMDAAARAAVAAGAEIEIIQLRDQPVGFCRNCRECTQQPGEAPGVCVQEDAMAGIVDRIEAADGLILASPTNFYSVTALFKRFMERLVVYAYWPWSMPAPRMRKQRLAKRAIVIASAAAPSPLARLFYATLRQLRLTAKTLGARAVDSVLLGLVAGEPHAQLSERQKARIGRAVRKLVT